MKYPAQGTQKKSPYAGGLSIFIKLNYLFVVTQFHF
jgi:hypothetical protein